MTVYDISICANTKARRLNDTKLKELKQLLAQRSYNYNLFNPRSLRQVSADSLGAVIIAVGGDGTVNAATQVALKYHRKLAVIAQGTFNHFAKDLGLPLDLEEAAKIALSKRTQRVDVGQVNDRIFLNNSVIGLYPHLVNTREHLQSKFGKWVALALSLIITARRLRTYHLDVILDGKTIAVRTTLLIIANNQYDIYNFGLAKRTTLDEGLLYLYVIKSQNIAGLIRMWLRLLVGRLNDDDFETYKVEQLTIRSPKRILRTAIDGESIKLQTPLIYKCLPKSLQVIAKK